MITSQILTSLWSSHTKYLAIPEWGLSANKNEKHEKFFLADTRREGIHGGVQEKQKSICRMLKKKWSVHLNTPLRYM